MWPTILRSELHQKLILAGHDNSTERLRFIDSNWPVAVDLATIMQISWRVREWELSGSGLTFTGKKNTSDTYNVTGSFSPCSIKTKRVKVPEDLDDPLRDATDERDLLGPSSDCPILIPGGFAPEWPTLRNAGIRGAADPDLIVVTRTDSDSGVATVLPPFGFIESLIHGAYVIFDPDAEMFYPHMQIGGRFDAFEHFELQTFGASVAFYLLSQNPQAAPLPPPPSGLAADVPQGTLTIINPSGGSNIEVPIGMFGGPGGTTPPLNLGGGSGSLNLTLAPVTWWPYKNSLGQPVYDSATGAQLVSPFS